MLNEDQGPDPPDQDEIDHLLNRRGTRTADLDRLARIISNMHQLEWKLVRQSRPTPDDAAKTD